MNIARDIIDRFGGQSAVANLIGKGQSTVQYWVKVGRIPAKWQHPLLKLAAQLHVGLAPSDFITDGADPIPFAMAWPHCLMRRSARKRQAIHVARMPVARGGKWVVEEDRRPVRVLAIVGPWAMVRRPHAVPYVCESAHLEPMP